MPKDNHIIVSEIGSSVINGFDYDVDNKMLVVVFQNGALYTYLGVPEEVVEGWLAADSKGSYFHAHIRNQFATTRGV
jgi:lysyl-tRNA synthetase class 2